MGLRILRMKKGDYFRVGTESARQSALRAAKMLRDMRLISFRITTYPDGDEFVISAI